MRRTPRIAIGVSIALVAAACGSAGLDGSGMSGTGGPSAALAMAESHGRIVPAAAQLAVTSVLPRTGWTVSASDAQSDSPASNVLDGNTGTFWHSQWSPATALPHSITINMGATTVVSGLVYVPRQDYPNGRIGQFQVAVSANGSTFGSPVATGTWADDLSTKTASFAAVSTRYVRLTALTEAGTRGPWSSAAEINLLTGTVSTPSASASASATASASRTQSASATATASKTPTASVTASASAKPSVPVTPTVPVSPSVAAGSVLSRTGWTVSASDAQSDSPASNVLDGKTGTFWHSQWSPATALPHSITIDLGVTRGVAGLVYVPRQDYPNGRIGQFQVAASTDGVVFGSPIATGTWADDLTTKTITFTAVAAHYVRLTALTEAGARGPWSSAAEINLLSGTVGGTTATASPTATASSTPTASASSTPTASAVPTGPAVVLPRTGWTATATDAQPDSPAAGVLDGSADTFWHSQWSPDIALPHSITIDMHAATAVSGLQYLPRQDGNPNGDIGRFQVAVSTDGTTFGAPVATGTWADSATSKSVSFVAVTARYVRLTGVTEAGDRGGWSSAAEINLLGAGSAQATSAGSWGPVITFPIVPVSAVMLPGNKLLTFSAYAPLTYSSSGQGQTQTAILDLTTGVVSQRLITDTGHEMFCSGIALLPDGRVLVNGGSDSGATSIYSPVTDAWTKGPVMEIPRAYEGDTTLSTGQVFTLGGSWSDGVGATGGKNAEVYTPDGTWSLLPNVKATAILTSSDPQGVYREDNHGWFFATADGGVFHAGPSRQMNWFTTTGGGSQAAAGNRGDDSDAMNGNAVMYDIGKIFVDGGATAYQDANATAHAYTLDINGGPGVPVVVTRQPDMSYARAFQNSVVLPDGKVLVIGGQAYPVPFTDTGSVMTPELWDPATGTFSRMASMAEPRNYHSVALLLPDGRVFSGGGGLCGDSCTTNHPDGQVFTPPYLLNGDGTLRARPAITAAPATAHPGDTITVTTGGAVSSFVLVRMGAVTHAVDSDQRRIPLTATDTSATSHQVAIPVSSGTVVPGNYMLFAMNAAGTPSVSTMVNIR